MNNDPQPFVSRLKSWMKPLLAPVFPTVERLFGYPVERWRFRNHMGYSLNLESPRSLNEKIVWKKLNNRNPLIPRTSDKHRVRSYVKRVLGNELAEEILIPQLYVTDTPEEIPFDRLPDQYIVKANHGSGMNLIVENSRPGPESIIAQSNQWLEQRYGFFRHEWAYQPIKRKIVVEQLLRTESGRIPPDYKFYVFHQECKFVGHFRNRFTEGPAEACYYDRNWNPLPVHRYDHPKGEEFDKPDNLDRMLDIAETLGKDFEMVRVDLYSVDNQIYFGELTHYPLSGHGRFEPESFDFERGQHWNLRTE